MNSNQLTINDITLKNLPNIITQKECHQRNYVEVNRFFNALEKLYRPDVILNSTFNLPFNEKVAKDNFNELTTSEQLNIQSDFDNILDIYHSKEFNSALAPFNEKLEIFNQIIFLLMKHSNKELIYDEFHIKHIDSFIISDFVDEPADIKISTCEKLKRSLSEAVNFRVLATDSDGQTHEILLEAFNLDVKREYEPLLNYLGLYSKRQADCVFEYSDRLDKEDDPVMFVFKNVFGMNWQTLTNSWDIQKGKLPQHFDNVFKELSDVCDQYDLFVNANHFQAFIHENYILPVENEQDIIEKLNRLLIKNIL